MFERDYETLGAELIRLEGDIGVVSATTDNFNLTAHKCLAMKALYLLPEP